MLKIPEKTDKFMSIEKMLASGSLDPVSLIAGRNGYK